MNITVKGKQLDVGQALQEHVAAQLHAIAEKYFPQAIEATVVLSRSAHLLKADISVHAGRGILMQGSAEGEDAYAAFNAAAERVGKRLRRHKRRLVNHHAEQNGVPRTEAQPAGYRVFDLGPEELSDEAELAESGTDPVVVAEMETHIETMTVGEAVMRLDLGDLPALMFRNGAHGGLNLVYRRRDGNVGWVDPRGNGGSN